MPFSFPSAAALKAALISSTVVFLESSAVRSTSETFGVGTRIEVPFSLPFSSGITSPIIFAAPVDDGIMLSAAAREDDRRRSEEHTLNSSHGYISYAVFCLKKKKKNKKVVDV